MQVGWWRVEVRIVASLRSGRMVSRAPSVFFFSSRRRHTRLQGDWSSDVCSSDLDATWYLGEYPDIAAAGLDPLTHYLKWGVHEQRNPNPLFDTAWYGACNPDVAAEIGRASCRERV